MIDEEGREVKSVEETGPIKRNEICEWSGCSEPAFCRSGNLAGKLVCREHFRITNGTTAEVDPDWRPEYYRRSTTLTPDELSSLQSIAVAASSEIECCLRIIERLTGQKIVAADEKSDDGDIYKCYYCGLPKSAHSLGSTPLTGHACHGLNKFYYPIRKECRSHPEIAEDAAGRFTTAEELRMLELLGLGYNAAEIASEIRAARKKAK